MTPSCKGEFPHFPELDFKLPEGFEDDSCHQDVCPCFTKGNLRLWVDYPNPQDRETQELKRFSLVLEDSYDEDTVELISTESIDEVYRAIKKHEDAHKDANWESMRLHDSQFLKEEN